MTAAKGTKTVWRCERDGIGPYNHPGCEALSTALVWAHCYLSEGTHPCGPTEFSDRWVNDKNTHYGLSSKAKLNAWFADFESELNDWGFETVKYEVPEGHWTESKKSGQIAYDSRFAVKV